MPADNNAKVNLFEVFAVVGIKTRDSGKICVFGSYTNEEAAKRRTKQLSSEKSKEYRSGYRFHILKFKFSQTQWICADECETIQQETP